MLVVGQAEQKKRDICQEAFNLIFIYCNALYIEPKHNRKINTCANSKP